MIKAFAPRDSTGFSWVLLSIVLLGGLPSVVRAQSGKTEKPAAAPNPPAPPAAPAEAAAKPAEPEAPVPGPEIYRDERAKNFLANTFPHLGKPGRGNDDRLVKAMAANQAAVDRDTIVRFVNGCIYDITDHGNIRAVIEVDNPAPAGSRAQTAIPIATDNLVEPILAARGANNQGFLATYNQTLLQLLPPLLENHLLARIAAAIVLSQTGSQDAIDVFVKELGNPDQTVWVALWAARGFTNISVLSRYNLDTPRAIKASKAVSDYLLREKDLPWPVQVRALEALGSLRQASTVRPEKGQPEMATTATQFLADPNGRLEVRAEAGWALGMMQVNAAFTAYNYAVLAQKVGEVAAALGERVHDEYPKNATQAEAFTGLLIAQIMQTFDGVDTARDSGLLKSPHPNATQSRAFIKQVADKTKPIAAAAVKLVKGAPGQAQPFLKELQAKVADLKTFLEKNPPGKPAAGVAQVIERPAGRAQ
jgi:hypothetical protein